MPRSPRNPIVSKIFLSAVTFELKADGTIVINGTTTIDVERKRLGLHFGPTKKDVFANVVWMDKKARQWTPTFFAWNTPQCLRVMDCDPIEFRDPLEQSA